MKTKLLSIAAALAFFGAAIGVFTSIGQAVAITISGYEYVGNDYTMNTDPNLGVRMNGFVDFDFLAPTAIGTFTLAGGHLTYMALSSGPKIIASSQTPDTMSPQAVVSLPGGDVKSIRLISRDRRRGRGRSHHASTRRAGSNAVVEDASRWSSRKPHPDARLRGYA
jgi:hypothetical protein